MYKWEYTTLVAKDPGPKELNMLGKEGWEAYAVVPIIAATSALRQPESVFLFMFKRQPPTVELHA